MLNTVKHKGTNEGKIVKLQVQFIEMLWKVPDRKAKLS
jgi:hypothetical protein